MSTYLSTSTVATFCLLVVFVSMMVMFSSFRRRKQRVAELEELDALSQQVDEQRKEVKRINDQLTKAMDRHRQGLAQRADQQMAWLRDGDPRGIYGNFLPVDFEHPDVQAVDFTHYRSPEHILDELGREDSKCHVENLVQLMMMMNHMEESA